MSTKFNHKFTTKYKQKERKIIVYPNKLSLYKLRTVAFRTHRKRNQNEKKRHNTLYIKKIVTSYNLLRYSPKTKLVNTCDENGADAQHLKETLIY